MCYGQRIILTYQFSLGCFSSCGVDSSQVFPVLWHATGILEMAEFKVDAYQTEYFIGITLFGRRIQSVQ